MKSDLPMKLYLAEQFNLRIERELKDDIRYLSGCGVDVSELVRPLLRDLVKRAKKQVEEKAS